MISLRAGLTILQFPISKLPTHLEARALLHPFFRFYLSVPVQVGAEVAVAADAGVAEVLQQLLHQQAQGGALLRRAGITGMPVAVKPALVADAYRVLVVTAAVSAR